LEVRVTPNEAAGVDVLMLRLSDDSLREVFLTLCLDVVNSTLDATSESEALDRVIRRTWRWHHLLRGGSDGRLSLEEQKGLIGELLVLEKYLLPVLQASDAVQSWLGPDDAPKDFQVGALCIEAKARRGSATPEVAISSESQLDTEGIGSLYLHVVNLASSPEEAGGVSVADVADRIRVSLQLRDPLAADNFESRLEAAGLSAEHDYSDCLWLEGDAWVFRVADGFPRIQASALAPGVHRVRYTISLVDCDAYQCEPEDLIAAVTEAAGHVDE
jgi:hypothetical protein